MRGGLGGGGDSALGFVRRSVSCLLSAVCCLLVVFGNHAKLPFAFAYSSAETSSLASTRQFKSNS